MFRTTVAESVGIIACLQNMAVVCEPIKQRRGHLGVTEDTAPLGEAQIGGNQHTGTLIELGEQVKQQRPPEGLNGK